MPLPESKKLKVLGVSAVLLAVAFPVHSLQAIEINPIAVQSASARQQTLQALDALKHEKWSQAEQIIAQTQDPVAGKLFYWLAFTQGPAQNWTDGQFTRLSQFIRQNPSWPGMTKLKATAEKQMPSSLDPAFVIAWYDDYAPQTGKGMDQYMQAMLSTGQTEKAKKLISGWWAEKPLGRDEQQTLFRKYFSYLDRNAHEKRVDALLFASQYTNARAIAQILQNGYPELVEARIALAEEKPNVNALLQKVPPQLMNDAGLMYERLRWRRRNNLDTEAIEILRHQPPAAQIQNMDDWWKERHIIIRRLLEKKQYRAAYNLAKDHEQSEGVPFAEAEWMAGWLALRFLGQPASAHQSFQVLYEKVKTPVSKTRAAYWAGRAAEQLGQQDLAVQWFGIAAQNQTVYYGQLAAAELSLGNTLPASPPPTITTEDKALFDANELVQAARLLHAANMRSETSQFIQAFVAANKTPKAYMYGAQLAAELKHYHDAIRISKDATSEGLFLTAQSYPLITDRLKGIDTEWALVHSIIRQESMFDYTAQSPAGALGMMQVMPATGAEVARKLGVGHQTSWLLSNPNHNIRLGSAYLDQMLDRFGGSYVLTIASYNAGPGRVGGWLETFGDPRTGGMDMIDWIEMIPVSETRNYVQRVLENVYVYRLRLKGKQPPPTHSIHIAMP